MTEERFSPKESLQLIQSMIDKTKQDISHNSIIYYLVWVGNGSCLGTFVPAASFNSDRYPGKLYYPGLYFKNKKRTFIKPIAYG
jgi:hypothetical protein